MKTAKISTWAGVFLSLLLFLGCQPSGDEGAGGVAPAPEKQAGREEPEPEGEEVTITITGNDNMKFDVEEFSVKARQPVKLVFKNVGTMPKESMGHNVVILDQDVDAQAFANAGASKARNEYIDPDLENEVIAATDLLGPGEEDTITFTAPAETGDYEYICSFPGHFASGMRGVMSVE